MMQLIHQGGPLAMASFLILVLGGPALAAGVALWYRRQDPALAARAAGARARAQGEPPLRQYEVGRAAALKAARPLSASNLGSALLAWALLLLVMGLVNALSAPSPSLVVDILGGRLELTSGQTGREFVTLITRTLVAGSVAVMMSIPALMVAGLGYGFLRAWLLGASLDRALTGLIADIDPEAQQPELQAVASGLQIEARHRWKVAAFVLGPFWYLYHGQPRKSLLGLAAWLVLALAGLGIWSLPANLIWAGDPLNSGTAVGLFWFSFRDTLVALCVLPVGLYIGTRGES